MPKVADLYVEIGAKLDNFDRGMKSVQKSSKRLEKGLAGIAKRLIAIGAVYFGARGIFKMGKSFLEVAATVEQYEIRLKTLLGSQKAATEAMDDFQKIASTLPFTLDQVIESGIRLTTIKVPFKDWLVPIADVAAAFGLDLPTATDQFSRAMSAGLGAADWFREKGITAMIRDFAKLKFGIDDLAVAGTAKLREVMFAWAKTFEGSSKDMSKTWNGIISMLQDKWFQFRDAVMQSGVFDILKDGLAGFNDQLDDFIKTGKLDVWAKNTAINVISAFKIIAQGIQGLLVAWHGFQMVIFEGAALVTKHLTNQLQVLIQTLVVMEKLPIIGKKLTGVTDTLIELFGDMKIITEGYNDAANEQGETLADIITKFENYILKLEKTRDLVEESKTQTKEAKVATEEYAESVGENLSPAMSNYAALLNYLLPIQVELGQKIKKTTEQQIDIFESLAGAMQSGITGIMNVLKQWAIGEFLKALSTAKMPFLAKLALLIPTVGLVNAAFNKIKGFQYEGVAHAPTVAMIAEREPERVIKESTFQRMRAEGGGGMSLTVAPVFTISAIDAEGVREFMRTRGLEEIVEAIKAGIQKPELKNALGVG